MRCPPSPQQGATEVAEVVAQRVAGVGAATAVSEDGASPCTSQLVRDGAGAEFFTARGKDALSGVPVGGSLSDRAIAALEAYVKALGIELYYRRKQ